MNLLNTNFDCSKYANAKSKGCYVKYFIGFDVRSVHVLRIQENINEDYEDEEGCTLLEHDMIDYFPNLISYFEEETDIGKYDGDDRRFIDWLIETKHMLMTDILKHIVDYDDYNGYENYDCTSDHCSVDKMVNQYINSNGDLSTISI